MNRLYALGAACLLALALTPSARAQIIPLPGGGGGGQVAFVVNSTEDNTTDGDGQLTLREAIIAANTGDGTDDTDGGADDGDVITFDPSLAGQTITLTMGELEITDDVVIGDGTTLVTISGGDQSRIFNLSAADERGDEDTVAFIGLTLTNGQADNGGCVFVGGDATAIGIADGMTVAAVAAGSDVITRCTPVSGYTAVHASAILRVASG